MTIKAITFPEHLSTGTRLGPGYRTTVLRTASGSEYRNAARSKPLHRYDVRKAIQKPADVAELRSFFHATRGALYGFRFWDPYDHSTASDHIGTPDDEDAEIGTGDGSNRFFQLAKVYSYGGDTMQRTITQPKSGSVVVAVNGAAQTAGVDFTVDTATGVVTFATAPTSGHSVTAGCEYYAPCRFGAETDRWLAINGDQQIASMQSILIEEIPDALPVFEMGRTGGAAAAEVAVTGPVTLSADSGLVQRFSNTSGVARNCWLPDKDTVPLGGPIFVAQLASGATGNVLVVDSDTSTTVVTLTGGDIAELYLGTDSSGNREWVAVS